MKCTIHTYLLNDLYSQELADSQNNGEQSPDNKKFDWEDEMNVSSRVQDVEELLDSSYFLAGSLGDGSNFSIEVPKMRLLKITSTDSPDLYVGASESIISEVRINRNKNHWKIEIYIKDFEPMANPVPGIYIASKEFPKELVF
jgi:hypothetical protein